MEFVNRRLNVSERRDSCSRAIAEDMINRLVALPVTMKDLRYLLRGAAGRGHQQGIIDSLELQLHQQLPDSQGIPSTSCETSDEDCRSELQPQ